jgi:hypothetical protein
MATTPIATPETSRCVVVGTGNNFRRYLINARRRILVVLNGPPRPRSSGNFEDEEEDENRSPPFVK